MPPTMVSRRLASAQVETTVSGVPVSSMVLLSAEIEGVRGDGVVGCVSGVPSSGTIVVGVSSVVSGTIVVGPVVGVVGVVGVGVGLGWSTGMSVQLPDTVTFPPATKAPAELQPLKV